MSERICPECKHEMEIWDLPSHTSVCLWCALVWFTELTWVDSPLVWEGDNS